MAIVIDKLFGTRRHMTRTVEDIEKSSMDQETKNDLIEKLFSSYTAKNIAIHAITVVATLSYLLLAVLISSVYLYALLFNHPNIINGMGVLFEHSNKILIWIIAPMWVYYFGNSFLNSTLINRTNKE